MFPLVRGTEGLTQHIITTSATRIIKTYTASPWEVFLRPKDAARFSIHYNHQYYRKSLTKKE